MTDQQKALVPVDERQVDFYGDELTAVLVQVGDQREVYVPLRPVVEGLGLAWGPQTRRLGRDAVLGEVVASVTVTATDGRQRAMTALPLKFLPGFLFGIQVGRVREELRGRILRYQRECYDVLWQAFQDGRLTGDQAFADLAAGDSPAAVAYRMAAAVMRLARQQLLIEERQERQAGQLADHEQRLEEVETVLGSPARVVTPAQATRISQAVKAIARELGERSGRNEYGGVYGELYRRFQVPSYRELPAARFDDAMAWLTEWWQQLTGEEHVPF